MQKMNATLGKHKTETLSDTLKCPVCLDSYKGRILQCVKGHDVCESCKQQLTTCPVCREDFTGTRNFSLEAILGIVDDLNILEPEVVLLPFGPKNYKNDLFSGPKQGKGLYQCRIKSCKERLPICRLLNHVRSMHSKDLEEMPRTQMPSSQADFKTDLTIPRESFTRAFQVGKFGLFFLTVDIKVGENNAKMFSWVTIAAPDNYAKRVRYFLEFKMGSESGNYNDIPYSTRTSKEKIKENKHCYCKDNLPPVSAIKVNLKIRQNKNSRRHLVYGSANRPNSNAAGTSGGATIPTVAS